MFAIRIWRRKERARIGNGTIGANELTEMWRVFEVPIGTNPLEAIELPRIGSAAVSNGQVVYCADLDPEQINDNTYDVTAFFSQGAVAIFEQVPRRSWDLTYRKDKITLPIFVKGLKVHGNGGAIKWDPDPFDLPIEYTVLNVSVTMEHLGNAAIRDIIFRARAQSGHIHIISGFPGLKWKMITPTIASTPESIGKIRINYSWENDPGNGGIDAPVLTPDPGDPGPGAPPPTPFRPIVPGPRLPFYRYIVIPSQVANGEPRIETQDLYPPLLPNGSPNPFYEPLGWQLLPGAPI